LVYLRPGTPTRPREVLVERDAHERARARVDRPVQRRAGRDRPVRECSTRARERGATRPADVIESIPDAVEARKVRTNSTRKPERMSPSYPKLHSHSKRPGTETELFGHARHVLTLVACTAVEYVFATHSEHDALLTALLNVPGAHVERTGNIKE
jgi:hypothetical protein